MSLKITPNINTPNLQQTNSQRTPSFSARLLVNLSGLDQVTAGLSGKSVRNLKNLAGSLCGSDQFVLEKTVVPLSNRAFSSISYVPSSATKKMEAVKMVILDHIGEDGISKWMKNQHDEWSKHNS